MTKDALEELEKYLISVLEDDSQSEKLRMRAAELLVSLPSAADLEWTV